MNENIDIWSVYVITCLAPGSDYGKQYIGITSANVYVRFGWHFGSAKRGFERPLYDAMRQYRDIFFSVDSLYCCFTKEDALAVEASLVVEYETRVPHGFNGSGRGIPLKPAHAKIARDRIQSPENRAKSREGNLKSWADPKRRKSRINNIRAKFDDPEFRAANRQQLLAVKRIRGPGAKFGRKSSFTRDRRQRSLL